MLRQATMILSLLLEAGTAIQSTGEFYFLHSRDLNRHHWILPRYRVEMMDITQETEKLAEWAALTHSVHYYISSAKSTITKVSIKSPCTVAGFSQIIYCLCDYQRLCKQLPKLIKLQKLYSMLSCMMNVY